ncbi:MAG: hypothetical protein AB2L24_32825 [Mangrovibacterium sp.]
MFQEYITREELDELPLRAFEGEIVVVDRTDQLESAINYLSNEKMIGFDTETKPSFKKGSGSIMLPCCNYRPAKRHFFSE